MLPTEPLKRIYDDLVMKSGIQFSFQTSVTGAQVEDGAVQSAACYGKSGIFAVAAKVFIDCTAIEIYRYNAGRTMKKAVKRGA